MKKIITYLLAGMLIIGVFSACAHTGSGKQAAPKKLSIICTIFPEYDWVREILGDHAEDADLSILLDNGVDLHSYQPTADDLVRIANCDLFLYIGGESDSWVSDALQKATNQNMIAMNLLKILGDAAKEEEVVEGMDVGDHIHDEAHEDTPEYDEHIWLSLRNAKTLCTAIAEKLSSLDPDHAADYAANAQRYIAKLTDLDTRYQQTVDASKQKTILFGDRFPFRYLSDDYGLTYYAAFAGCSAETEASFETIVFLAKKVDEQNLSSVLTIEGANHKIAETIIQNTKDKNQTVLSLNSMQSITSQDAKSGVTYLSVMESNLGVLKRALGGGV